MSIFLAFFRCIITHDSNWTQTIKRDIRSVYVTHLMTMHAVSLNDRRKSCAFMSCLDKLWGGRGRKMFPDLSTWEQLTTYFSVCSQQWRSHNKKTKQNLQCQGTKTWTLPCLSQRVTVGQPTPQNVTVSYMKKIDIQLHQVQIHLNPVTSPLYLSRRDEEEVEVWGIPPEISMHSPHQLIRFLVWRVNRRKSTCCKCSVALGHASILWCDTAISRMISPIPQCLPCHYRNTAGHFDANWCWVSYSKKSQLPALLETILLRLW